MNSFPATPSRNASSPGARATNTGYSKVRASQLPAGAPVAQAPPRPRTCLCSHHADGHFARGTGPCKTKGCTCSAYRPWRPGSA